MNITLWIIAGLLALASVANGAMKLPWPREKLASRFGWVEGAGAVKAIGTLEVLAAVGLVLPAALDIAPVLVPLAALGLVLIMVGAVITRLRRHEPKPVVADLAYLALAGFVAWGRFFGPESFTDRQDGILLFSGLLLIFAAFIFLWFVGTLHGVLRGAGNPR
jgi:DoxX-like family